MLTLRTLPFRGGGPLAVSRKAGGGEVIPAAADPASGGLAAYAADVWKGSPFYTSLLDICDIIPSTKLTLKNSKIASNYEDLRPIRVAYFVDKKRGETYLDEAIFFNRRIFSPNPIPVEPGDYDEATSKLVDNIASASDEVEDKEVEQANGDCSGDDTTGGGLYLEQSRRKAIRRLRNYSLGTPDLNMFVTLTLSPDKVQRDNYDDAVIRVGRWLDNKVRRDGLHYVLVPEHHADGGIHFHGLFNRSAVRLEKSGLKRDERGNFRAEYEPNRKGKVVYNLPDYDLGFTTAIRLGKTWEDRLKAVSYCIKYMTKATEKVGGRWYLHGGDLGGPVYAYFDYDDPDNASKQFDAIPAAAFDLSEDLGGMKCKILRGKGLDAVPDFWKMLTVSGQ